MQDEDFIVAADLIRLKICTSESAAYNALHRVRVMSNLAPYSKVTWGDYKSVYIKNRDVECTCTKCIRCQKRLEK